MKPTDIRRLRQGLHLDQLEFAAILGLTNKQAISRLEHGAQRPRGPLAYLLGLYARRLNVAQEEHARQQAKKIPKIRKTG